MFVCNHWNVNSIKEACMKPEYWQAQSCLNWTGWLASASHNWIRHVHLLSDVQSPILTSSVWNVSAVESWSFPPVENVWVLQQVQRGKSVTSQRWEDEVQKTAHAFLQTKPVSLTVCRFPQRRLRSVWIASRELQSDTASVSLVLPGEKWQIWKVCPKNAARCLLRDKLDRLVRQKKYVSPSCWLNFQSCKNKLMKHQLPTSLHSLSLWPLPR